MDFLVFSHLRWDFVYQRPQHLLSRCARQQRVFFWEEPVFLEAVNPELSVKDTADGVTVCVPQLPQGLPQNEVFRTQETMLKSFLKKQKLESYVLWYYTPMARNFSRDLDPEVVIYDCMDELSGFRGAPPGLRAAESELFDAADLVFTGGRSLYESKRNRHPSVHCFPSSIDVKHFAKARRHSSEPEEQAGIAHPKLGFAGVIDERMDLDLIRAVAESRPEWQLVMIGPVVKISETDLPRLANIHYLGARSYGDLPSYMSGWDVGMLPFALNDSTKFISPTKMPEYLAAGLPVVSTPITDVVRPYGESRLAHIAATPAEFIAAVERCLAPATAEAERLRLQAVDDFLALSSWDRTWSDMRSLILAAAETTTDSGDVRGEYPGEAIAGMATAD